MYVTSEVVFLGTVQKESKKTGNPYLLVKVMDTEQGIFEFYVGVEKLASMKLSDIQQFSRVTIELNVHMGFGNKIAVDLESIKAVK